MHRFGVLVGAVLSLALMALPAAAQFQRKAPVLNRPTLTTSTTLKACVQGTCREGLGSWLTGTVTAPPTSRSLPRDFSWKTASKTATAGRWQVSTVPFRADVRDESYLISAGNAGSAQMGLFSLTFSALPPLTRTGGPRFKLRAKPMLAPQRYYVRVLPMANGNLAGAASNVVTVEFSGSTAPSANPLAFHTTLKACAQDECKEGLGAWLDNVVTVSPQSRAVPRQFMWKTDAPGITGARWQVATKPFGGSADGLEGVISQGDAGSLAWGRFTITFTNLPPMPSVSGRVMRRLGKSAISPHYYVRLIPMMGAKPANGISNTVRIDFPQTAPEQKNPLVQLPTDNYTVSILEFQTIKPQTLPWGCLIITGVDTSAMKGPTASALATLYKQNLQSGQPVCPKTYRGIGEKPWYESLWDFTSGGVSWVSSAYAGVKKAAIKAIVVGINAALPGNPCGTKCTAGLTAGLDAGLVALGVPPNLPNMQDLTNGGMNYLVQVAASQAGIDCDAACQNAIRSGIQTMAKEVTAKTVASYCGDVEEAHRNGAEPLCLPPGVTAIPAPGSANQPAHIKVRITRKPNATVYSSLAHDRLTIGVHAVVPSSAGHKYGVPTNTCYTDTSVFPCDVEMLTMDKPISGALFKGVTAELPHVDPGHSIDYTFYLTPAEYWLPGHKALMAAKGGSVRYNDWWHLYQGARLTIRADAECPVTIGGTPQLSGPPMASCAKPSGVLYASIPGQAN